MPIVTLLSDFGSASPYPAAMRAVLTARCAATLLDISHDVPRHDVRAGAYLLRAVAPQTPAGTVHLAVVDPGVGTARRALIIASGGQCFVGPDNGLLLPAARRVGAPRAFVITDETLLRAGRASTFHGRDLFAPAAARLAAGTPPEALGAPAPDLVDLPAGRVRRDGRALLGEILYVDPFGNLVTNIPVALLPRKGTAVVVQVGRRRARGVVRRTYGEAPRGALVVVPGSDEGIEVAVREGRAAQRLGASPGARIRLTRAAGKAGRD